ncbi:L-threonine 3-dehydrogenase [Stieleria neptunia]|uniref:L-threonine 3-dehydrogenase n=1 Tax=Stieleria neptunia TaxID=2527979 RepID=A0A518I3D5_9BACT|nr:alcohol dehydrogenase catalytic domain-containing protein [Stieleria neptunia]QDV47620.1 L-threonine 3-dehydrogenase [Stieleria neptunia]
MRALVRTDAGTVWKDIAAVTCGPGQVLVQVSLVGLCRTDLAVAAGRIKVKTPRILGHEFVGRVVSAGSDVRRISIGDKIAADPVLRCGRCDRCLGGWQYACPSAEFMGVDVDGAIAERVAIPEQNAWRIPDSLDDRIAALLEPVAACAAVMKAPIGKTQFGVVFGHSRLARLTAMILQSRGFENIRCVPPNEAPTETDAYDFAIDTEGTTDSLTQLVDCLRPGGVLVLKSRPLRPLALDLKAMLPKEHQIFPVNYAEFGEASRLLLDPAIDFASLLGDVWSADQSDQAFQAAENDAFRKHFIELTSVPARPPEARTQHQCVPSSDA